ncbi:MAG: histidinol dehydrogenase [Spirochaetales bacterium]|nr:histidinol dehydrogenase [Spirochaetales bacterium]
MSVSLRRWNKLTPSEQERLLSRSEIDIAECTEAVSAIIDAVRHRGDTALREFSTRFDQAPSNLSIRVPQHHFDEAEASLPQDLKEAIAYSVESVRRYHADQCPDGIEWKEVRPGAFAGERTLPIDSAAFYVPRARGSFPSMLYMMAIPAKIAGVARVAVASPPDEQGRVDAACLYTARLCGVDEVYAMGGAQAWAALAYGTETVQAVDKCLGPGSKYVAAAKRLLGDVLDCGLPAGPSESIILADGTPDAQDIARNLLVEAEHGADSAALLITPDETLAQQCGQILEQLIQELPEPRQSFVTQVLRDYGGILLAQDMDEAVDLVNRFATEHLQVRTADPFEQLPGIRNAGEILLGEHTPFSVANYSVGANAVLPTGGRAKTWSGVSVRDFKKQSSVIRLTAQALREMGPHAARLASYEGFPAHEQAITQHPDLQGLS